MRLSGRTIDLLKNFTNINPSLLVREGSVLSTISPTKKVMAIAKVDEHFNRTFGIYELSRFLGALGLMKEPDLELGEASMVISDGDRRFELVYSGIETITAPPEKELPFQSDASFELSARTLNELIKAQSVLGTPVFQFRSRLGVVTLETVDPANPSSNQFAIQLEGQRDVPDFLLQFRKDTFRFIPNDYRVDVSLKRIARLSADGVTYFVVGEVVK